MTVGSYLMERRILNDLSGIEVFLQRFSVERGCLLQ